MTERRSDEELRHELVEAAVKEIAPLFINKTAAWNAWNYLNTSGAFLTAIQHLHAAGVADTVPDRDIEWGVRIEWDLGTVHENISNLYQPTVHTFRDQGECERFIKDKPLWFTGIAPIKSQSIVTRQKATDWAALLMGGEKP